ncbi:phenol hydroxylase subunit P4 [Oceanimonas baumannii]|uniref:phenol hydroxylase subunit P4 n=1 Tax=Oceanimonas baumannii TaxID=129578 RepID=UPI001D188150|nr:phenol hydroxylase subunit P4 [Oceanimonas baumannii]MCC4265984.1 phenol hydroxylase subunit P4 [Oceanimonas baumannii]
MPVIALNKNYQGSIRDAKANFGGNILVYIGWDEHLLFCSAKTFPLSPTMLFSDLQDHILTEGFSQHPDFEHIDWSSVQWTLNGKPLSPSREQTLEQLGFDHKSLLRFRTPGLNGYKGTGV